MYILYIYFYGMLRKQKIVSQLCICCSLYRLRDLYSSRLFFSPYAILKIDRFTYELLFFLSRVRDENRVRIIKIFTLSYFLYVNLTQFSHKNLFKNFSQTLFTFIYVCTYNSKNLINSIIGIKSIPINNLLVQSLQTCSIILK